jgi:CrcB protein
MLRTLIFIGIGGGLGSVFRYLTSLLVVKYFRSEFPWATFVANIIGCFLIGLLVGFIEKSHDTNSMIRYLFITGFCGGYTTFSTFSAENISLFQSGQYITALIYILLSVTTGITAVWFGLFLMK